MLDRKGEEVYMEEMGTAPDYDGTRGEQVMKM